VYIYVDESGDRGLYQYKNPRRYFALGFVHCIDPSNLRNNLVMFLDSLHRTNLYPKCLLELKFSLPECKLKKKYSMTDINNYKRVIPYIRNGVIDMINRHSDGVFMSIVDKNGLREKTWTSETLCNYVFAKTLQQNILSKISIKQNPNVFFDKGRLDVLKEADFIRYLYGNDDFLENRGGKRYTGKLDNVCSIESHLEPCIWASDFIAGSIMHFFNHKDLSYFNKIDNRLLIGGGLRKFF
jgi:hypothetical protein